MGARLAKKGDLFKFVLKSKQSLKDALEKAENLFKESYPKRASSSGRSRLYAASDAELWTARPVKTKSLQHLSV